jgi:FkbM family methyltransferase
MTIQGALLRANSFRVLRPVLRLRTWRVESGQAAGLLLRFPQNAEYIRGTSELPVQNALAEVLSSGQVFYDVGANVGFFSLIAAKLVGDSGKVFAFEPLSENAEAMRRNARLNGMSNVTVVEAAVGSASGSGELHVTDWDGGSTLIKSALPHGNSECSRAVKVITLDDFVRENHVPLPSVIKIDVEGLEAEVLHGALETILVSRPTLIYEVDDADEVGLQKRWSELDEYVRGLGFNVEHLQSSYPEMAWKVGHSLAVACR